MSTEHTFTARDIPPPMTSKKSKHEDTPDCQPLFSFDPFFVVCQLIVSKTSNICVSLSVG